MTIPVLSILVMVCGGEVFLESFWRDRDIVVDGTGAEWGNTLTYIEMANMAIGICNDAEALYLVVVPWNQETLVQVARSGCVIRFGTDKANAGSYGIHFPFGDPPLAMAMMRNMTRTETVEQIRNLSERETIVELLDSKRNVIARLPLEEAAARGIEVSLGEYNGRLLIEAKVPYQIEIEGNTYHIKGDAEPLLVMSIETPRENESVESDETPSPPEFTDPYIRRNVGGRGESAELERTFFLSPINLTIRARLAQGPDPGGD